MRSKLLFTPLLLLAAACPVDHASVDATEPTYDAGVSADAGGVDGAALDAAVTDLVGVDLSGVDVVRADTSAPDLLQSDAARPDTAVVGVDSALADIGLPLDAASADSARADVAAPDTSLPDSARPDTALPDVAAQDGAIAPDEAGGLDDPRDMTLPVSSFPFNLSPAGDVDCFRISFPQDAIVTAETLDQATTCEDINTADTVIALYAEGETDPENYLLRDDDGGPGYCSVLRFAAAAGSTYVLCVDAFSSSRIHTDLTLSISTGPVPADEAGDLSAPLAVTLPEAALDLSLVPGDDTDCFSFHLDAHSTVSAQVTELGFSDCAYGTELLLYAQGETDPGSYLDRGVPDIDCAPIHFALDAGDYVICLGLEAGPPLYAPDLQLALEAVASPVNDGCLGASALSVPGGGAPVEVQGDTSTAFDLRSSTIDCHSTFGGVGSDLFYTFTTSAQMDGFVELELETSGWNGVVYAFADSCQASADLSCGVDGTWVDVAASTTYYVVVDAYDSGAGAFTLRARYLPPFPNQSCAAAEALEVPVDGSPVEVEGVTAGDANTRESTVAGDRCQDAVHHAPELFYSVTTGASAGTLHVELETDGWDGALYAFPDTCAAASDLICYGQEFGSFNPLWFQLGVDAHSTTYLVVDGYGDTCCSAASGRFNLRARYLEPAAPLEGGETCDSAPLLAGASGRVQGSTAAGLNDLQPSDVGCFGSAYGYDKFYKLTLAAGQSATVIAAHSDPYNEMVVYLLRGDCPVRGDSCLDDFAIDWDVEGALSFSNTSGASADYFIVIDAAFAGHGEDYQLSWQVSGP